MYFLIGKTLSHSFSADYFNKKFSAEKIDNHYDLRELDDITEIMTLLDSIESNREKPEGFNVTIPYKESIIPYLDELTGVAECIGAVNTVRVNYKNGKRLLTGHNTDAEGFSTSLRGLLKGDEKKALVLGTGGASKAVIYALRQLGITSHTVSRSPGKGQFVYEDLTESIISGYDLVINTTPLGTYPKVNECPDIPYSGIKHCAICFDLVYNPAETRFMTMCRKQGATVSNGLEMLHNQALAAWDFWQGKDK